MNYLTPERLVRLQDRSDETHYLAALDDWEHALRQYREHLLQLGRELPPDLHELLVTVALHDARVLDMWWGGRSQFTITLHPELPPSHLVVLTYSLLEPPSIGETVLPDALRSEPVAWLYDELDRGEPDPKGGPGFLHRILLSDGREVRLRFRSATVKRPVPVVPAVPVPEGAMENLRRHSA
jgi:hypothetical protein